MSVISYREYQDAFRAEQTRPMLRFAEAGRQSLEVVPGRAAVGAGHGGPGTRTVELQEPAQLEDGLLAAWSRRSAVSWTWACIDESGSRWRTPARTHSRAAPTGSRRGSGRRPSAGAYVSDVFLGYRGLPHIVVAIRGHPDVAGGSPPRHHRHGRVPLAGAGPGQSASRAGVLLQPLPCAGGAALQRCLHRQRGAACCRRRQELYGAVLDTAGMPPSPPGAPATGSWRGGLRGEAVAVALRPFRARRSRWSW